MHVLAARCDLATGKSLPTPTGHNGNDFSAYISVPPNLAIAPYALQRHGRQPRISGQIQC